MSEKESITTLLTLLDSRQVRLAAACYAMDAPLPLAGEERLGGLA